MKKRIITFIFALVTLFISLNTIQAKEVKLSDLNDLLSDDVNSAYIKKLKRLKIFHLLCYLLEVLM